MNFDFFGIGESGPMYVFLVAGACVIGVLLRFMKVNDLTASGKRLQQSVERAEKDPEYRRAELADATAAVDAWTDPAPGPMKRHIEIIAMSHPKILFFIGSCAVIITYVGWFQPSPDIPSALEKWGGPALLLFTAVAAFVTLGLRKRCHYLQQLNRKYVMEKTEGLDACIQTLDRILIYYPKLAPLWLERSDQFAKRERMDEALESIAKAREVEPKNIDLAVVEVSYLLRTGKLETADMRLGELEGLKASPTDPRVEIYRAQLALLRNEKRKAVSHAEKAAGMDSIFTTQFLDRETSLRDLKKMMQDNKLIF